MGTWNAFYVKATIEESQAIGAIRRTFGSVEIEVSSEFLGVRMKDDEFDPPERVLTRLSKVLTTDVIWMGLQSAVGAFQFRHWSAGKCVRSLVFGCYREEGTWEKADGVPEVWEREVFFIPKDLKLALRLARNLQEKQEIKRIWKEAEIMIGRRAPRVNPMRVANEIARIYQLPW